MVQSDDDTSKEQVHDDREPAPQPPTRLPAGEALPPTAVPGVRRTSSQRTSAVSWGQRDAQLANVRTLLVSGDIAAAGTWPRPGPSSTGRSWGMGCCHPVRPPPTAAARA